MQQEPDTQHLPIRRSARVTSAPRYRYMTQPATDNQGGRLSYALLIIILFQTLVLSLIALFLGLLLLLNFGNLFYRPPSDADVTAILLRTPTPAASMPITPTVTATNTETLVPNALSPELQVYANQVLPLINNLQGALDQLRALAQNPNLNDQAWVDNVRTQLTSIQTNQAALQTTQAPPVVLDMHNGLLNALTACSTGADILSAGIGNRDANSIAAATPYTQSCFTQFPEAANRLHSLLRQ